MVVSSTDEHDENYFEELDWLKEHTPCFRISADNINVLREPDEFYQKLKVKFIFAKLIK